MSNNKPKETKGKRKGLPKLKTILANPNKDKCPALDDEELQQLQQLLSDAISNSNQRPQQFATSAHIRLGLESSLRAINNSKCSCVLLSLTIQPRFLVRLIARNVEAKDATVPVYVQSQLEEFTKDVFGIRALALVLPTLEEMRVSKLDTLIHWIESRTKRLNTKIARSIPKRIKLVRKTATKLECKALPNATEMITIENTNKQWGGDFISFSDVMDVEKVNLAEDEQKLEDVLRKVAEKTKKPATSEHEEKSKHVIGTPNRNDESNDLTSSDSDDFLPEMYKPLTVHKIQANPNKKPKKKRQKKNKQKKN
ncbi:PREDICTED: uncharacterized protein LOC108377347 [Rhagoletis zephyria]|uniref:uncharacterized protein LOC108377347 n=1 Tax=Rhagoletis zephyria TaxID=28612 RepID=UPI00081124FA|nr:PREDICTED: uncharacterized protein LOC108377347 [Rhagoletis zephyria]